MSVVSNTGGRAEGLKWRVNVTHVKLNNEKTFIGKA